MKLKINELVLCSMFSAITAILSQIYIPLPFTTVPVTLQIFAVALTGIILGAKKGFISVGIYIVLGAIGMPVFAGMTGGLGILLGPTGGFLIACPIMAFIIGYASERYLSCANIIIFMIVGLIIVYLMGTLMFALISKTSIYHSFLLCVVPFIFVDILKLILATSVGISILKRLNLKSNIN